MEKEKLKNLIKLNQKKYRDLENKFLVETEHLVEEAIKYGEVLEKFSLENKDGYSKITLDEINKLSTTTSSISSLAVVKKLQTLPFKNKIIALDRVQDPGNLGTIIRSMVAFSFFDLLVDFNSCDIYNSKVIRSSQGAIFQLNFKEADLLSELLKLKEQGYKIIGTSITNAIPLKKFLSTFDDSLKYVLVMGNEGKGIREEILNICDELVFIEINNIDSLNVAIALSVILYELNNK